ncbi:DMT family transporter [Streptomyces sp. SCSIO 30461]|uniref:DMT family transporter n=1 Tax=Streptomyces sp. SCSIO 30461 TaxID=3118085 RepID=UPI0030CE3140
MSSLALSALLSLVSVMAYASAAVVQERVAAGAPGGLTGLLRDIRWWASTGLNALGALLHVVALAYGPLSLVQPLGALTIVFALPLAAVLGRRRVARTAWRGALMAAAGLAGLLALSGPGQSGVPDGAARQAAAATAFAAVALLFLAGQRARRRPLLRGVLLAAGAGVAYGAASLFTKIAAIWPTDTASGRAALLVPGLAVIAGLATVGLLLSQLAYSGAGLAAPLATVTVVNPVVAAVAGLVLFGEGFRYGTAGAVAALVCAAVAGTGLVLLSAPRRTGTRTATGKIGGAVVAGAAATGRVRGGGTASDRDPVRPEVGEGVDIGAVPRPRTHFEVEMRSGAVAGGP